ncbi:aldo/keto reductase [Sphingomonas sp. LaA6.9]|uniref:aldo/keto reductase n=1 Tax=Sphingomonas sp. LaA6.9 TaxID=2919914 RepID=UPI001F4F468C|nr:aldo/keto reductase [Sphingomonas sp. LaA6.9]MCJ8158314.1 aldo/keto reductase [Sphingomonas sp. LaA6.9]
MSEMRTLGRSGLKTPRLVLGGNVFGWTAGEATSFKLLDRFVAAGGTMIDTADVYSAWIPGHRGGESETVIGRWLKQRGRRDDILIATKVGMMPGEGGSGLAPARIAAAAEASLTRLNTDYVDLYYAHQDDPAVPQQAVIEAFDRLVLAGKVRALGASNFTAERLASALDISAKHGLAAYSVVQPEFNLMTRDRFEGALQALCIEAGLGVLPYFGLAAGFLTGKYRGIGDLVKSQRGARIQPYLGDRGGRVLGAMDALAVETGATLAQIALAWNAAQPGVTAPIASATSVAQLDELLEGMTLELSADQLARLDAASQS